MARNLSEIAEAVRTEADFLQFLRVLRESWDDREERFAWENGDIGTFLSGMLRWAEDVDHSRRYDAPPDWSLFAFMLLAGKEYE